MPARKATNRAPVLGRGKPAGRVAALVARLEKLGSAEARAGLARYGLPSERAFGVSVGDVRAIAKEIGRDHDLAEALWDSGWQDARMLAAFIGEPERLTAAGMDRWARQFDSWGICDTACFHLFDRAEPALAFRMVRQWSRRKPEFERRSAFALLASLALHAKRLPDAMFIECLPLIEAAAPDGRNFVKKGVSWALNSIGRRSPVLHAAAKELATKLSRSDDAAERWVGKDSLRYLSRVKVRPAAPAQKANARGKPKPARATPSRRRAASSGRT